ncbi:RHS repeat-associated core domain-containing protein [Nonomuraea sp. NPDC050536]|uniref:RHS repeat-associated core domain-containing protein n=1 Tax=Nonomuraea sp. NPDC050536 TaxID=3364366 RepID=UPI0037CB8611
MIVAFAVIMPGMLVVESGSGFADSSLTAAAVATELRLPAQQTGGSLRAPTLVPTDATQALVDTRSRAGTAKPRGEGLPLDSRSGDRRPLTRIIPTESAPRSGVERAEVLDRALMGTQPLIEDRYPSDLSLVGTLTPLLSVYAVRLGGGSSADFTFSFSVCEKPKEGDGFPEFPPPTPVCVDSGDLAGVDAWQVPAGKLSWGKEYQWWVQITDSAAGTEVTTERWTFLTGVRQPQIASTLGQMGANGQEFYQLTGNYRTQFTDASVGSSGSALSVVRTYNSLDPRTVGSFGAGWSTQWDMRIAPETNLSGTATLLVTYPDGHQERFAAKGDGTFQPPPGDDATLAEVSGGGWRLMDKTSTSYVFDAQGRLTRITSPRGRAHVLDYGTDGKLAKLTGPDGRSLSFTWAGSHIATVSTDPVDGKALTWTYEYQGDNLLKVCAPVAAPNCTTYGYGTGSRYRNLVLDSDPIGYWRFGEATNDHATNEGSEGGNGSYVGVAVGQPGALQGTTDTAAGFTKSSVQLPNDIVARLRDRVAIEDWFKTTSNGVIFSAAEIGYQYGALWPVLYVGTDGKLRGQLGNIQNTAGNWVYTPITTAGRVNDGQWHHVVLNVAGDRQQLYLDGQKVGELTGKLAEEYRSHAYVGAGERGSSWSDVPGGSSVSGVWPFQGSMDEFALYGRPLAEAEIQTHYAARVAVANKLATITLPSGRLWANNTYDSVTDRITTHVDQNGGTWKIGASQYDWLTGDSTITVTDPRNETIQYKHDRLRTSRLLSQTDQLGKTTSYDYDTGGYLAKVTDANGNAVETVQDKRGNTISTKRCRATNSCQTTYADYYLNKDDPLDPRNDRVLKARDARSASATDNTYATSWEYNQYGEQTKQTTPATTDFPNGRSALTVYTDGSEDAVGGGKTPAGLVKTKTDPRGSSWSYKYTAAGDLAEQTDPAGLVTKLEYDAVGQVITRTQVSQAEPAGVKTTFAYDGLGRVLTETGPGVKNEVTGVTHTKQTRYTYDADSNKLTESVADLTGGDAERTTTTTYDTHGHPDSVTGPEGGVVRPAWNVLGTPDTVTDEVGAIYGFTYTKRGEVESTRLKNWTGSPVNPQPAKEIVLESFAYDPAGRLASRTDAMGRKTSFTYYADNLRSQAIGSQVKLNGSTTPKDVVLESDTYDAAGNPTQQVTGGGITRTDYVYDAAGRRTSATTDPAGLNRKTVYDYDANGNTIRETRTGAASGSRAEIIEYAYNAAGVKTKQTVKNGADDVVTSWTVDDRGLITTLVDPRGNASGANAADFTITNRYDALGRLVEAKAPQVTVEKSGEPAADVRPTSRYGYDTVGNQTQTVNAEGRTTATTYDKADRPVTITSPTYTPPGGTAITPTISFGYDAAGRKTQTVDPRGYVRTADYDALGNQVRVTDPGPSGPGGSWVTEYDLAGEQLASVDPTGARVEATYDDLGRQITQTEVERKPSSAAYTTSFTYNDAGVRTKVVEPGNKTTSMVVNPVGEVTSVTNGANNTTTTSYDLAGRPVRVTDATGNATENVYDLAGRTSQVKSLNSSGTVRRTAGFDYDLAGNQISQTSGENHTTRSAYDALNRLISMTEPVSSSEEIVTRFGYDAVGARTKLTDGRGNTTWTAYNTLGLVEQVIEPATTQHPDAADRTWTYSYDKAGNSTSTAEPGGVRIDRTFDHLGRLTQEDGAGGGAATAQHKYGYDPAGRTTTVGDFTLEYNDRGRLTKLSQPSGTATTMAWDANRNLSQRVDASGTANFTWDGANRLATATDPVTGRAWTYGYDKADRVATMTSSSPVNTQTFGYDDMGRPDSQTLKNSSGTELAKITYGWDLDDNLTTKTTTGLAGNGTNTYGYDFAGRLTSWKAPDGTTTDYGWDAAGNRIKAGSKTYTYDERNRLTSGDDTTYSYTARGTLASQTKAGTTTQMTFDAFDRLIADGDALYAYDGFDRIASRIKGPAKTLFAYSGTGNDLAAITDSGGAVQAKYSRDPNGGLLGLQEGTNPAAGAWTDLHDDLVATYSGTVLTGTTAYNPFGEVTAQTGPKTNLGYQGEYTDPDSGKVNMAARWYQPGTGTFTSRDTQTQDPVPSVQANRYTYANASPLTGTDPTGHSTVYTGGTQMDSWGGGSSTSAGCNMPVSSWCDGGDFHFDGIHDPCELGPTCYPQMESNTVMVMTKEQMKMRNAFPNGEEIWDGFWGSDPKIIDQIIAKAYNDDVLGMMAIWAKYKRPHNAGGKAAPIDMKSWNTCVKNHGAKACQQMREAAQKTAKQIEAIKAFYESCIDKLMYPELQNRCEQLIVQAGLNSDDIVHLVNNRYLAKEDNWLGKLMKDLDAFFFQDLYDCSRGNYGACVLFAVNFIPIPGVGAAAKGVKYATKSLKYLPGVEKVARIVAKVCRRSSFPSGTLVVMADGSYKAIEDIRIGDEVVATDPSDDNSESKEVVGLRSSTGVKDLVKISLVVDGEANRPDRSVVATFSHPFWVPSLKKWVQAVDLHPGEWLETSAGGRVRISSVARWTATQQVHNLTITDMHTYYVLAGGTPILVHNAGCDEWAELFQKNHGGEIKTFYPPDGAPSLGDYTLEPNESWKHHTVVVKDGRVYDQYTGSHGMPINEWKREWHYHEDINFGF